MSTGLFIMVLIVYIAGVVYVIVGVFVEIALLFEEYW